MTLINSRTVRGRCPICSGEHAACGPPSASVPVDETWEVAAVGGPLEKYEVTLPGGRVTTMKLNEEDAKRYDATLIGEDAQETPEEKADTAENKARTTQNKARTPRTKAASGGND